MTDRVEQDCVYRLNQKIAHTTYVDDHVVLWRLFDPRKKKFLMRGLQSTPRWYFEKHMKPVTVMATVDEVIAALGERAGSKEDGK